MYLSDKKMIPKFKAYFYPFLLLLQGGEMYKIATIRSFISAYFNLSEADLKETTKGGLSKHESRTNWAVTYLKKMGLIQAQKKGAYSITSHGKELLDKYGEKLDLSILRDLESYKIFQTKSDTNKTHWVEGHYRPDGTYVPGYMSNFFAQGLRKKKNDEKK
jgi:restriction system protein